MAAEQSSRPMVQDAAFWEAAFEDETSGFIALISRAQTPDVLRGSAAVIIQKLFARKDDRPNVSKYTAELNVIVPEDASPANLDALRDGVIELMRSIKEERKQKVAQLASHAVRKKPKKAKKGGERRVVIQERKPMVPRWVAMAVLGVIAVSGVAAVAYWSSLQEELPPASLLVDEMRLAARGAGPLTHVYGGALKVRETVTAFTITAEAVPRQACVSAAWDLVGSGRVMVNGVTPSRVTAAVLAELCASDGEVATLIWIPKE
ncbi:MAG: hypothetical protein QGI63_03785 [Rhodospirillales bacterium]|jgi:hypothetical protein|nr:hypothetical protein [Rhodospirillales bacterium]MDP6773371.1 hypothetical protein [Rhodospirillales bacterium]